MMRRALVIATVAALAVARPETYREKEDFQYSRSSSDEGSKSGFYGAQRGNMGGNYERAHNMDTLAQHQMGGLVRTVDGELGDGAKQKSGSVFSAANSRGVYGSGHYDLSNVQGRNFQEGTSFGESQSQSALSSQQAGYGSQSQSYSSTANSAKSQNSRYTGNSNQALSANNLQAVDNLQSAGQYDGTQSSLGSGYSQSGYQGQSIYNQASTSRQSSNNAYGTSGTSGSQYRLVGASPVRVYVRPGSTVTIPVAAQSYDASQGYSSIYDQNSQSSGSTFNQNSINRDTEVLGTDQQRVNKPANGAKSYESSYSYRKAWEKHDTVTNAPLSRPTVNLYPSNSELREDTQAQGSEQREAIAQDARNVQSSSQYRGYNTKSASSRHQAAYDSRAQEQSLSTDAAAASSLVSSSSNSRGGYDDAASANLNSANLNSQVEDFGSKPKSYQSSYSYHKSWERQGDPYVIKPSTKGVYTAADSQASQRLTSSSLNQASSQRYGSQYRQGQQGYSYDPDRDCDENGHIRVARSPNPDRDRSSYQQSQNTHEGQEYVGQQSQNLEDLGQQSQNLENLGQQSQNLEDFGQQSQNLHDFGQQSQNLEDLGQQSQNLDDLGQQSQNLENLGQQSQNLEDFGQQSQKLEDFGQQTQDAGQLTQNFDRIEDLSQQTQPQWDQQSQTDAGQQTQNTWSTLDTIHSYGDRNKEKSSGLEHTGFNHRETQGSVYEINHPSPNQPESHTTPDRPNPFAHTIFDEHRPDQEKTELDKDSEKEFPQLDLARQPGQFDPFWKPSPSNVNQNNQDVYHLNTGYSHNQHHHYQSTYGSNSRTYQTSYNFNPNTAPEYVNPGNAKPVTFPSTYFNNRNTQNPGNIITGFSPNAWMFPPPSLSNYNHNTNLQNPENANVFTNTQTYNSLSNHTYSTSNVNLTQESGSSSLTNLWDLIDDIEKQTISEKETENSNHMYQENTENVQHNSNLDLIHNFNANSFSNEDKVQHSIAPLSSTTEPNVHTTTIKQDNLHTHDVERGDIEPEKQKPQEEAGRGDIGPDDNVELNAPYKPLEILGRPTKPTVYKSPEEIESLSLTKENNKTTLINSHSTDVEKQNNLEQDDKQLESVLGVLSLDDQKKLEHHSEQDNKKLQNDIQRTTTPKSSYHNDHYHFNVEQESQQNTDQQQGQSENTDQQSDNQYGNFDQQNTQLVDLGQQGENVRQERNMDQQNIDHHESTFEHGPDEVQQNTDQQSETLGQQTQDLQSFNQFEDLEQKHQQSDNFGQQSEGFQQESIGDFGQQSEGFQQESLGSFGQQSENLGQKQSNNFGQQNEGFQQESLGSFGQQSENLGQKQSDNLGQQSEGFQQESLGDFGQQSEHFEQKQSDNFGQQSEGFQQESLGDFGQQGGNLEQKQSDNFGQQSEGFQQESLGDFGQQSENLEQKQSDNFRQQTAGFQQESLGDFGQREQLQQESLSKLDLHSKNFNHSQKDQQLENWGQENDDQQRQSQSEDQWKTNSKPQLPQSQVETFVPSVNNNEGREPLRSEPVVEPEFVTQKTNNVDTPPEPVTEKVGFWNKVGSKFTGAKDKVKSWFSSS